MRRFTNNCKGLLVLALALSLFMLAIEFSLLGVIENARSRVLQAKRREVARSLADMGETYARMMRKKHGAGTPEKLFPPGQVRIESSKRGKNITLYSYTSPGLFALPKHPESKTGVFTLEYYYQGSKLIQLVSIGNFEGITFKKVINL